MPDTLRPLAVVTGAFSGVGYELARQFAQHGFDLVVAADRLDLAETAQAFAGLGVETHTVQADLSTEEGVMTLWEHLKATGRPVDVLAANAGAGLGHAFLDEDFDDAVE